MLSDWPRPEDDPHVLLTCDLEADFKLSPLLAEKLATAMIVWTRETSIGISVISGFRSEREQEQLRREGRPTAAPGVSTHTICPAQGADIQIHAFVTTAMKARWGRIVVFSGLRWGGGSPVGTLSDPEPGIPSDWNHVDTGPRR